ncbi:MAG: hypothetical protein QM813_08855 [Verrucomicrobiota bacterium]
MVGNTANFPLNFTTYNLGVDSTVTYDNTGAQTISPRAYGNLIFAGSGTKTITNASTSVAGTLSIAPTAGASNSINAGLTINVGSLKLGGLGRINGTWGGNTSGANYTNTTYFAATTGKLNVANDTRIAPTVTTWPTATAITYGQALSSSTLSGAARPLARLRLLTRVSFRRPMGFTLPRCVTHPPIQRSITLALRTM